MLCAKVVDYLCFARLTALLAVERRGLRKR
jgi:hypothetical protein